MRGPLGHATRESPRKEDNRVELQGTTANNPFNYVHNS